jgi:hypothetical protein
MTVAELIAQVRASQARVLSERKTAKESIDAVRALCATEDRDPTDAEATQVTEAAEVVRARDAELATLAARLVELEDEQRADEAADALARTLTQVVPSPDADRSATQVRVGAEPRTYARENDPKGVQFLRDVALSAMGDSLAGDRLSRHMREEVVDRAAAGTPLTDRAVGTSAFAGLVVPQYLVDLVAPNAKAGRPFADAIRHHDLPDEGMTVNLSKITTGTSADVQAAQGDAVSETNIDDTLLSVDVQTNAGQQTVARQAIERGAGIDGTTIEDLVRSYHTSLDGKLINQATTGLTNVATSIAYTDASPTAAELYPKLLAGPAAVEAALLDMDPGDGIAVMHSRRWYWLQSQLSSTFPLFGQPGVGGYGQSGVNFGERYGAGFRGVLPNGTPVIVDNNIATNLGAGTNEDEIYFVAQSEGHLWEDPNAPLLIRADQTKAANLQILLVVYGYFAYTFTRRAHAQKVAGTGLVTPTF